APANYVAKWDGNGWSPLGSGMGGCRSPYCSTYVLALAVSGSDVYAGGIFLAAGGLTANSIAKWDGNNWSTLGSGVGTGFYDGTVWALAVNGSNLYVGGDFYTAGGLVVRGIAKWN